ncbi:MAG: polyprenyl synthetase family protein [Thermoanaerobaculaceae bacterium]
MTTKLKPSPALLPDQGLSPLIDEALRQVLKDLPPGRLGEAMYAAVFPGGKRLRPRLLLLTGQVFAADPQALSRVGAALELVHCASLVLDDLPCMDNAMARRGQPALHLRFSEATAVLAAFGLLARAMAVFPQALEEADLAPAFCQQWSARFATLVETLCRGQEADLDLSHGICSVERLEEVHAAKTGAFFQFAAELGAFVGGADLASLSCITAFARNLGLAYQVVDDILDVIGEPEATGKLQGQDRRLGRPTFVTLLGVDAAATLARELLAVAKTSLNPLGVRAGPLQGFVDYVQGLF